MNNIHCLVCKEQHKARSDKFPITVSSKVDQSIIGYVCKKCVKKHKKGDTKNV